MKALIAGLCLLLSGTAQAADTDAISSDVLMGKWNGVWSSQRSDGKIEREVQTVENGRMAGRVKVTYSGWNNCSTAWEKLAGSQAAEKIIVQYNLGGLCGKLEAALSLDGEKSASGTWS